MLDLRPRHAKKGVSYRGIHFVTTVLWITIAGGGGEGGNPVSFLPTASHPGRLVGSRQSLSTMRAAPYMSRKVAMSVCS